MHLFDVGFSQLATCYAGHLPNMLCKVQPFQSFPVTCRYLHCRFPCCMLAAMHIHKITVGQTSMVLDVRPGPYHLALSIAKHAEVADWPVAASWLYVPRDCAAAVVLPHSASAIAQTGTEGPCHMLCLQKSLVMVRIPCRTVLNMYTQQTPLLHHCHTHCESNHILDHHKYY